MSEATYSGLNPTPYSIVYDLETKDVSDLYFDDGANFMKRSNGDWEVVTDEPEEASFLYVIGDAVKLFDTMSNSSGTMGVSDFYEVLS